MDADAALARLAARQRGLFTRRQARVAGVTDRMLARRVAAGLVIRVEPGIYRFAAAPPTWEQGVLAACLAEDGWASHRTAAALWGFEGCRRGIIEVLTPRAKRRPNASVRVHETRRFDEDLDGAVVDGIPVSSRERTLVDLAAVLPSERVAAAYHDALNRRLVTPELLWTCLERLDVPGRPWVAVTRRLVANTLGFDGVLPNRFEQRLVDVLVEAGLPAPATQVEIRRPDGSLVARVDAGYPDTKVLLECDSERWHGSWVQRKRDFQRDRELTTLGYRVLRLSWEDLEQRPADLVRDVVGARRAASA